MARKIGQSYPQVNLIDRTLSKILVLRGQLQLLGVACLNLAAKYAEDRGKSPLVEDLAEITDRAYTSQEILQVLRGQQHDATLLPLINISLRPV